MPISSATHRKAQIRRAVVALGAVLVLLAAVGLLLTDRPGGTEATTRDPGGHAADDWPIARTRPPVSDPRPTGTGRSIVTGSAPATTTDTRPEATPVAPVAVRAATVGIESALVPVALHPDNTLQVPDDPDVAGWYTGRAVPGAVGAAVIVGHIDSRTGPAVFFRLGELPSGAVVEVLRSDGSVARFRVGAVERHPKTAFPTERVYGPTSGSELRLVTCGGSFDHATGHYRDNVIVFATLEEIVPATVPGGGD